MGQDPSQLRSEIEETRGRLGETAEAIGYKSDVKGRAGDWATEKKNAVTSRLTGAKDNVAEAMPDRDQAAHQARRGVRIARENPLGLALGGVAVGFLAGLALPSTRAENERLGEASERVTDAAKATAQDAFEHGKEVAKDAAQAASQTAQQSGKEHAQELGDSAQQHAEHTRTGA
jgi:hypothetical protein